jgi:hypothetical protein
MRIEASNSHTMLTKVAPGASRPAIVTVHFETDVRFESDNDSLERIDGCRWLASTHPVSVQLLPLTPEEIAKITRGGPKS